MRSTKNVSDVSPTLESKSYARKRYYECADELMQLHAVIKKADEDIRAMYVMQDKLRANIDEWAELCGLEGTIRNEI